MRQPILYALMAACACQSYQFEPVSPRAIGAKTEVHAVAADKLPPSLMLVVDRSGSMIDAADGSGSGCTLDGAYDPSSSTPCKWNDLKGLLAGTGGFLEANASIANFGLVLFAGDEQCGEGTLASGIGPDAEAKARAAEVARLISAAKPVGGTPTALSLGHVLDDPPMRASDGGRDRLVMLLTDGAPNCNSANAALCTDACSRDATTCDQIGQCQPTFECDYPFLGAGCLDEDGTVAAVRSLAARGIRTFVIGFGADTRDPGSDAYRVLDAAAQAGGLARGTEPRFYQANSASELSDALAALLVVVRECTYTLSPAPASADLIEVAFAWSDGSEVVLARKGDAGAGDWVYDSATGKLAIEGARCEEIQSGPDGLTVEIRYLEEL